MLIFLKLIQKTAEAGTFSNTFYEFTITLIPKPKISHTHPHTHTQNNYSPTSLMNIDAKF